MLKRRKTNPNRMPATVADVKKAAKASVAETIAATQVIFFTVLRDKNGFNKEDLLAFWENVKSLSEEIVEGRVSISDLRHVLKEEADIFL